jgi:uncharacterized protein (DUF1697 family)
MASSRRIVLLRGVNLGPRNRVGMPELRAQLHADGFEQVSTYLQSGNVVLTNDASASKLAAHFRGLLRERFKLDVEVVVRTRDELAEVVARDPLGEVARDPKRYQVSFLERALDEEMLNRIAALAAGSERLVAIGRELYAWHPHGVARSKLWAALADRRLGVTATARNWSTVGKLLTLAENPS